MVVLAASVWCSAAQQMLLEWIICLPHRDLTAAPPHLPRAWPQVLLTDSSRLHNKSKVPGKEAACVTHERRGAASEAGKLCNASTGDAMHWPT